MLGVSEGGGERRWVTDGSTDGSLSRPGQIMDDRSTMSTIKTVTQVIT